MKECAYLESGCRFLFGLFGGHFVGRGRRSFALLWATFWLLWLLGLLGLLGLFRFLFLSRLRFGSRFLLFRRLGGGRRRCRGDIAADPRVHRFSKNAIPVTKKEYGLKQ